MIERSPSETKFRRQLLDFIESMTGVKPAHFDAASTLALTTLCDFLARGLCASEINTQVLANYWRQYREGSKEMTSGKEM